MLNLKLNYICYSYNFCDICYSVFSQQENSLLLLRHLRTFRGPSWSFLFLSLEFCYICYSCDFYDYIYSVFQLARKILVIFAIFETFFTCCFSQEGNSFSFAFFCDIYGLFGSPSWPFLFLSLEFCYICYSCDFLRYLLLGF